MYCRTLRPLVEQLPADAKQFRHADAWATVAQTGELNTLGKELMLCLVEGELHASPESVRRLRTLSTTFYLQLQPYITCIEALEAQRSMLDVVLIWRLFRDMRVLASAAADVLALLERLALDAELALAQGGRNALGREKVPPWDGSTSNTHKAR